MDTTPPIHKRNKLKPGKRSVLRKATGLEWLSDDDKIRPVRGERALWRAVILQTLEDATSNSKKTTARYNKTEALNWLEGRSEDFTMVCDLAGLFPHDVRSAAKRALLNGCKWRLPAGHGPKSLKKKRLTFETKSLTTPSLRSTLCVVDALNNTAPKPTLERRNCR